MVTRNSTTQRDAAEWMDVFGRDSSFQEHSTVLLLVICIHLVELPRGQSELYGLEPPHLGAQFVIFW